LIEAMRDENNDTVGRRSRILDGARAAFLRFGYERTSLADIAAGAGVSRTALYHYFPSKEVVFRAVVDELHARSQRMAIEALENSHTLSQALTDLLEAKFGRTLAVITESPHGIELVDATHRLTGAATQVADNAFQAIVVQAFIRYARPSEAEAVADTLFAAAKGLMRSGDVQVSKAKFEERIQRLVAWALN
jgi:AcrR family transcriptional regulator